MTRPSNTDLREAIAKDLIALPVGTNKPLAWDLEILIDYIISTQPRPSRTNKQLLGQLIAEIAKFGGASKEDASRLARILLPHIDSFVQAREQQLLTELLEATVDVNTDDDTNVSVVPASVIQRYREGL